MYKVELTTSGGSVVIYFNGNLTVHRYVTSMLTGAAEIKVIDGNHNNGGWLVLESYEEVIAKIDAAIAGK
jgi:hypothetical protein